MNGPLHGCYLKLGRGEEHLLRLKEMAQGFVQDHPIPVLAEADPDTSEKVWHIVGRPAHPPDWWSLLFGEGLYNLRSALDHLAYQLVVLSGNTPTSRTEFPIFKDPGKYASDSPRKVAGMRPEMVARVDALQPWKRAINADAHPFWWLQDLGNIDKHRELHLIVAAVEGGIFTPPLSGPIPDVYLGGVDSDTELLRLPPELVYVEYTPVFGIQVDIPNPPMFYRRNLAFLIDSIAMETRLVVNAFAAEFFP